MIISLEIHPNPFLQLSDTCTESCCVFKKCCKSYKKGKRCKKCPDR